MEKSQRKIFQPNALTNELIEGVCNNNGNMNITDFVNIAIKDYFTPVTEPLKKEAEFLFTRILNREIIAPEELKATLSRCVEILKDYPISDCSPLEQIFIHFTTKKGKVLRYDYIQLVDDLQDARLHRLNEILKTVDSDFNMGMREFGERSRTIFAHWNELCSYSEIYTALSTLIECESIYYKLDTFRTIDLIRWLDICVRSSKLTPIKTPFETNISISDRYYGLRYEVSVYHTDSGYMTLSGDVAFENMPSEIRDYYNEYMNCHTPHGEVTETDLQTIQTLESKGRTLFRRLSKRK